MSSRSVGSTIVSLFFCLLCSQAVLGQSAIISEIHYDNTGGDTGEAIEITGASGADLTGWSVVLYNGNGGTSYDTEVLAESLSDCGNGQGELVINYPSNGIQNGAPDGIALVDDGNNVVEFLSYEGGFTAVGGPADGMTSTDIGVAETSSTPVGDSLQLSTVDATWQAPAANTFGALNDGTACADPDPDPPGEPDTSVFINELHYDNAGSDVGEFVEVAGPAGKSLLGWEIVLYNGNGGASYNSISLDGVIADEDAGFGTLSFAQSGIQNGAPDGLALVDSNGNLIQFLSYEGSFTGVGGAADGLTSTDIGVAETGSTAVGSSLQLQGALLGPDGFSWVADGPESPGSVNDNQSFGDTPPEPELVCTDPATLIHEVQGSGSASPVEGSVVTVDAVVVGDFVDGLNGFFLQEEDAEVDGDPLTSEGLFVFAPGADVSAGDRIRVRGEVDEFFDLTELTSVSALAVCDSGLSVSPASPVFPLAAAEDLEVFEGMSVHFQQSLVIAEYFNYDRFGEMVLALPLTGENRPLQPTSVVAPGAPANARQLENDLRRITLDDGSTSQNPAELRHPNGQPYSLTNSFRGGDTITDVVGVLNYSFGLYRIQPTDAANFVPVNPRDEEPDPVGGSLRVASFNVLNYFTTLDESGAVCGPSNLGCRGADNAEELERQRSKIIAALAAIDADVFGLIELENNDSAAISDLVDGLNAQTGGSYAFIDTGTIGGDAIKVGLIYRGDRVLPSGPFAVLDASVDPTFVDDKNRPVLAQTFAELASGARMTVAVNHLKSKGSDCDDLGDPDTGDGQGNCNLTRTSAAVAQVQWLANDPTGSGDADLLIIGDLNAYAQEDPVAAILVGADGVGGSDDDYRNLILEHQDTDAYSFVFSGQFGYLDHALANLSLEPQVSDVTEWHINADESDVLDYNTDFKSPEQIALFEPNAFRSSDHDPVIIGLALQATLADLIRFLDDGLDAGRLEGISRRPATDEFRFRGLLIRAERFQAFGLDFLTCFNLARAEQRIDGFAFPKDWIEGESAGNLSAMITSYRDGICH